MRKVRAHSDSNQVDLYPEIRECPACQQELKERYHKQGWIIQLSQELKVKSHYLECRNCDCELREAIYRPAQEGMLALPGYNFGLDVVAGIGELRYRDNFSISKIATELKTATQLQISIKEVELLCEVYLALVTTVAHQDQELMDELRKSGGIVLVIDGIQPEKSHETLYLLRDVRTGRVLVAKNLLSSATEEIEKLIEEVKALALPILGVISDKQDSIRLAVEDKLAGVPHQICHYHYLKDLAQPVSELDRHLKKELKKKIRGVRDVERKAEEAARLEAQVVADYCLA
ncbi:MAG: transposase, partial [Acidobacteriota bacterium]